MLFLLGQKRVLVHLGLQLDSGRGKSQEIEVETELLGLVVFVLQPCRLTSKLGPGGLALPGSGFHVQTADDQQCHPQSERVGRMQGRATGGGLSPSETLSGSSKPSHNTCKIFERKISAEVFQIS